LVLLIGFCFDEFEDWNVFQLILVVFEVVLFLRFLGEECLGIIFSRLDRLLKTLALVHSHQNIQRITQFFIRFSLVFVQGSPVIHQGLIEKKRDLINLQVLLAVIVRFFLLAKLRRMEGLQARFLHFCRFIVINNNYIRLFSALG